MCGYQSGFRHFIHISHSLQLQSLSWCRRWHCIHLTWRIRSEAEQRRCFQRNNIHAHTRQLMIKCCGPLFVHSADMFIYISVNQRAVLPNTHPAHGANPQTNTASFHIHAIGIYNWHPSTLELLFKWVDRFLAGEQCNTAVARHRFWSLRDLEFNCENMLLVLNKIIIKLLQPCCKQTIIDQSRPKKLPMWIE